MRAQEPTRGSGEERLLLVRLAGALRALAARRTEESGRAREWVCAPSGDSRLSFRRACERLGLEPARLRRRLGLRAPARHRTSRGWRRGPR
jgi:hypothetical protein